MNYLCLLSNTKMNRMVAREKTSKHTCNFGFNNLISRFLMYGLICKTYFGGNFYYGNVIFEIGFLISIVWTYLCDLDAFWLFEFDLFDFVLRVRLMFWFWLIQICLYVAIVTFCVRQINAEKNSSTIIRKNCWLNLNQWWCIH
jgi:hypothetical protein